MPKHRKASDLRRRDRSDTADIEASEKSPRDQLIEDLAELVIRAHRARQRGDQ